MMEEEDGWEQQQLERTQEGLESKRHKLELANERLLQRLKSLRQVVHQKNRSVSDLEAVLYTDLQRMQHEIPRWFYALMGLHFFIMLQAWPVLPWRFAANMTCFFWLQRRFYRDIHPVAVPLCLFVLMCSVAMV